MQNKMSLTKDSGTMLWESREEIEKRASDLAVHPGGCHRVESIYTGLEDKEDLVEMGRSLDKRPPRLCSQPLPTHIQTEVGTDTWGARAATWWVGVSHCISAIPWPQDLGQSFHFSLDFIRTALCILQGCEDMGENTFWTED